MYWQVAVHPNLAFDWDSYLGHGPLGYHDLQISAMDFRVERKQMNYQAHLWLTSKQGLKAVRDVISVQN